MTVSVVEIDRPAAASTQILTATLAAATTGSDVLIVAYASLRSSLSRSISTISGCGATWSRIVDIDRVEYWMGVNPTGAGAVTVTQNAAGEAAVTLVNVRGLTATTAAWSNTNPTIGSGVYGDGPSMTAGPGQFVFAAVQGTYSQDLRGKTPAAGWDVGAARSLVRRFIDAIRVADTSGVYQAEVSATSSETVNLTQLVIGEVAPTGPVTVAAPALAAATSLLEPVVSVALVATTVSAPSLTTSTGLLVPTINVGMNVLEGGIGIGSELVGGQPVSAGLEFLYGGIGLGSRVSQRRNHLTDPRTNLPQYRLVAVDMNGTPLAELHKASMTPIEDEVNGAGGFSFTVGSNDPKARNVMPRHGAAPPEVQVWRGDMLVGWYVVKTARPSGLGLYTFDCVGLRWYYGKRFIDRRPRRFLFRNGTFGSMFMWWDRLTPAGTVTASIVASDRGIDGRAVRLEHGGVNLYGRSGPTARHLRQRRRITQPTSMQSPLPIRATVDMRVLSFAAPTLLGYGVKLSAVNVNDIATVIDSDEVDLSASYMINEDTPRDRWHEVTLEIDIPANGIEHIVELRLVPPGTGVAEFTNVDVSPAEQLAYYDDDQAWIVGNLSDNAQDSQWGKVSLNIGRHTPLTGVLRTREYEFADHKPYLDAMNEYPALYNGVEWDIATTATTRTLTTFYPRQGSASDAVLALGHTVVDYDATVDLDEVANSVVVQGLTLGGSDRKERHALDAGSMGGALLEGVVMADGDTPLPELDEAAAQVLAEMGSPAPPLRVTCHPRHTSDLLDRLHKGDTCRVIIGDGLLDVDRTHRAMRRTLDPNTDGLTYDLTWEA